MSTLMFWNKQNGANSQNNDAKTGKRNWLHAPDVLVNGHVAYLVKFLGNCPVEQAKGIEVVKDAIRCLQFAQQLKKAEVGSNVKTKKVEITVSIDGVAVQEPRTQTILHQFPLHKISYCADEKGVKKFFSFIAKTGTPAITNGDSSTPAEERHECFVFISNKLASDITLTIGQAFDLAYRRYMNDSGKFTEMGKLQSQNKQLELTVSAYRHRLKELSEIMPRSDLDRLLARLGLKDIYEVPHENGVDSHMIMMNGKKTPDLGIDVSTPNNDDQLLIETSPKHFAPIVPPRNIQNQINSTLEALKPSVGTKLEGLLLNSDSDSDFDPRACESDTSSKGNKITNDLFGFEPFPLQPQTSLQKTMGQQLFASSPATTNGIVNQHVLNNNLYNSNMNNNINNINNNNNINYLTNGTNGNTNGHANLPTSPPLLAPPPKAAVPRRSVPQNNNNNNSSQDLFGSVPFNPHPVAFDTLQQCDDIFEISSDQIDSQHFAVPNVGGGGSVGVSGGSSYSPATTTAMNVTKKNPFNESGIFESDAEIFLNPSPVSNSLKNDIAAFTSNSDKLDDILKNSLNQLTDSLINNNNTTSGSSGPVIFSPATAGGNVSAAYAADAPAAGASAAISPKQKTTVASKVNPFAHTKPVSPSMNELKKETTSKVNLLFNTKIVDGRCSNDFENLLLKNDVLSALSSASTTSTAIGGGGGFNKSSKNIEFCNQIPDKPLASDFQQGPSIWG